MMIKLFGNTITFIFSMSMFLTSCESGSSEKKGEAIKNSNNNEIGSTYKSVQEMMGEDLVFNDDRFHLSSPSDSGKNYFVFGYFSEKPNVSKAVILTKLANNWYGKCFSIKRSDILNGETPENSVYLIEDSCMSIIGWNKLYSKIEGFDLLNLPDQRKLKNIYLSTGGDYVRIRMKVNGKIRDFRYFDIFPLSDKYIEVRKIKELVSLFENELGYDLANNY